MNLKVCGLWGNHRADYEQTGEERVIEVNVALRTPNCRSINIALDDDDDDDGHKGEDDRSNMEIVSIKSGKEGCWQ